MVTPAAEAVAPSRRERILRAAVDAFATHGFHGASTRDIAELAGVTDPLLFYYFKSKADLYLAAVQDQLLTLSVGLDEGLTGLLRVDERLRRFVTIYLAYFLDHEPGLTVTLRELRGVPDEAAEPIAQLHHQIVTLRLQEILESGFDQGVFRRLDFPNCAQAIIGILQMFIRLEARAPGSIPRAVAIDQVMEYYVPGLRR